MAENEELFKTTLMGGFDKDDVLTKFQEVRDQAYAAQKTLEAQIEAKNQEISELSERLREQERENEKLQKDISEKYQSYIDNYESIGQLMYDAQVSSKKLRKSVESECAKKREETYAECEKREAESREKCDNKLKETRNQCERMIESARQKGEELAALYEKRIQTQAERIQGHMEQELASANEKYRKIYAEMDHLAGALEQSRKQFEDAFYQVSVIRREMQTSVRSVEKYMEDPVKADSETERKEKITNPEVLSLENEAEYLDEDMEAEETPENEIERRITDEDEE